VTKKVVPLHSENTVHSPLKKLYFLLDLQYFSLTLRFKTKILRLAASLFCSKYPWTEKKTTADTSSAVKDTNATAKSPIHISYYNVFQHQPLLNAVPPIAEKTQFNALHLFSPTYLETFLTLFKAYLRLEYSKQNTKKFENNFETFLSVFGLEAYWEGMIASTEESLELNNKKIDYSTKYSKFEAENPITAHQQSKFFD
jgi:hypothetical protein